MTDETAWLRTQRQPPVDITPSVPQITFSSNCKRRPWHVAWTDGPTCRFHSSVVDGAPRMPRVPESCTDRPVWKCLDSVDDPEMTPKDEYRGQCRVHLCEVISALSSLTGVNLTVDRCFSRPQLSHRRPVKVYKTTPAAADPTARSPNIFDIYISQRAATVLIRFLFEQ